MATPQRLGELPAGARARIAGYAAPSRPYLRRLLAMGLVPGAEFTVLRRAPLGDPVEIELLGLRLALRADEAAAAMVIEGVAP